MQRVAQVDQFDDSDELMNDRIPGLPLLGLMTGALLSLAIWGAVAVIALTV